MVEIEINHEVSLLRKRIEKGLELSRTAASSRRGQYTWNVMADLEPELMRLLPRRLDPFHRDQVLDEFWEWIEANWHRRAELIREEES